jgi:hypothetical protein
MKPQTPEVHTPIAEWVKRGGVLVFCDDDSDAFNSVHEWWNTGENKFSTPREPLFAQLGFNLGDTLTSGETTWPFGKGQVIWLRKNPAQLAGSAAGAEQVVSIVQQAAKLAKLKWRETNSLLLRRGPYVIAAGLDESIAGDPKILQGHFVNLFDPELRAQETIQINPGSRYFLRDLEFGKQGKTQLLASACKAMPLDAPDKSLSYLVEGVAQTPAVMLFRAAHSPTSITLDGQPMANFEYSKNDGLLRIRFENEAKPRTLQLNF